MATWQHDYFLLPQSKLVEFYDSIPTTIAEADFYDKKWWEGVPPFEESEIEAILPPFVDRDGKTLKGRFGTDAGNRFSITYADNEKSIAEVLLRIDLTEDAPKILDFVQRVAVFAKQNELAFLSSSGRVVLPEAATVLEDLKLNPTDVHRVL